MVGLWTSLYGRGTHELGKNFLNYSLRLSTPPLYLHRLPPFTPPRPPHPNQVLDSSVADSAMLVGSEKCGHVHLTGSVATFNAVKNEVGPDAKVVSESAESVRSVESAEPWII